MHLQNEAPKHGIEHRCYDDVVLNGDGGGGEEQVRQRSHCGCGFFVDSRKDIHINM